MEGFGLDNLPYGVARRASGATGCVSALGDDVIDLATVNRHFRLGAPGDVFEQPTLNAFLACGRSAMEEVRGRLAQLVRSGRLPDHVFVPRSSVRMLLPVDVGDFVDFSASLHHATNMGTLLRPGADPLPDHWRHLPVAYHGRSSSIVVSGTAVRRPGGQVAAGRVAPTDALDYEAEVGFVIGQGTELGDPVPARAMRDHVAGLLLVNDWSARDLQATESRPLGPFTAKSFATSVSPWLVTLDALEPYRVPSPPQDPPPAGYLTVAGDWAYDLRLEVLVQSEAMRREDCPPVVVSRSSFAGHYWTIPQMLAHATVNGARLRTGDLFASGAISGPEPGSHGTLSELAWGGSKPVELPDGSARAYLHDGDTVVLRGTAGGDGRPMISLGEVSGTVLSSHTMEG
ncbi:MAG: fumarylacetoacetase [Acidimicrobiales bacterium]